jgi:hypothetical protein
MRNNKSNQLRKNPLVRFMRWVYRSFRDLFQPKKSTLRPKNYHQIPGGIQTNFDSLPSPALEVEEYQPTPEILETPKILEIPKVPEVEIINQFPTVSELFGRVKWQLGEESISTKASATKPQQSAAKSQSNRQEITRKYSSFAPLTGLAKSTDNLLTVTKLFGQVQWQLIQETSLDLSRVAQPPDVSRN